MTEPLESIPYYRRPRTPPKRRRWRKPDGKPVGSFVAVGSIFGGRGPIRRRRSYPTGGDPLDAYRAAGVPVFDGQASNAELGGYVAPRRDG